MNRRQFLLTVTLGTLAPSFEKLKALFKVRPTNVARLYFVDEVHGQDRQNGLTPETAFATLEAALDACDVECKQPFDIIS